MTLRLSLGLLVTIVLTVLWVSECTGPRPVVGDVRLDPPASEGAPYRVEASVTNTGRGHGEVAVTIRLRDESSDRSVQTDRRIELDEHETTRIIADIVAPTATYTPDVEAIYPPR
jgi:hypothetical protein